MIKTADQKEPEINSHGIIPLRYYKHVSGKTYFLTGFAVHAKSGKTVVVYTDGYTGIPLVEFAEEFVDEIEDGEGNMVKRFTLIERK